MEERKSKEKKNAKRNLRPFVVGVVVIVAALLIVYFYFVHYFTGHFYWKTQLNGFDVGAKTADEAKEILETETEEYLLTIYDRDGKKYHIKGSDIDYVYESTGEEEKLLNKQNAFTWPRDAAKKSELTLKLSTHYDEQKLQQAVAALDCFKEENITHPQDAYINTEDHKFELVKEVAGNELLPQQAQEAVKAAVDAGMNEMKFTDKEYKSPAVTSEDKTLSACMAEIKKYTDSSVVYDIEGYDEKVDGDMIASWLTVGDDYSVTVDENAIAAYVQTLATKYNTYGRERQFKTTQGDTITIGGGDYGFVVQKEKEAAQLKEDIASGKEIKREPVYEQTALLRDKTNDIGDTYVEVDYTNQHMWYYKEGNVVFDADFVSGDITKAKDMGSPDGIFKVNSKSINYVMVRPEYTTEAKFFVQFASNVGFHDADDWRHGQYGGNIYRGNGSHGCINVSLKTAEWLYNNLPEGTPVVAFYRTKVKLTSQNNIMCNAYSSWNREEKDEEKEE